MTDILNQRNMSSLNYGKLQIKRQMVARENEQLENYQNVVDSINALDEVGNTLSLTPLNVTAYYKKRKKPINRNESHQRASG